MDRLMRFLSRGNGVPTCLGKYVTSDSASLKDAKKYVEESKSSELALDEASRDVEEDPAVRPRREPEQLTESEIESHMVTQEAFRSGRRVRIAARGMVNGDIDSHGKRPCRW